MNRNDFLDALALSSPTLQLVFLNHLGAPSKMATDFTAVDLLADKAGKNNFIHFCQANPLVKQLTLTREYQRTRIMVSFLDGSEMQFVLLKNLNYKTLRCLDVKAIRATAIINAAGMLVPSPEHHYEYMIFRTQFGKTWMADRFQTFFSNYDATIRSQIFKHMQSRFHLVFNTLEDLYEPRAKTLLNILIGLRYERTNSLMRMFFRAIDRSAFSIVARLYRKTFLVETNPASRPGYPASEKKSAASRAV